MQYHLRQRLRRRVAGAARTRSSATSIGRSERELQAARTCNTNEYVSKSRMMTVRVAPELLDAVKARAKRLGRSASAEVVLILERELEIPSSPVSAVMGMFSGFEEMAASEFRRERRRLSRRLLAAARETASK